VATLTFCNVPTFPIDELSISPYADNMETTLPTTEYLSIRQAAEELGVNRTWLSGHLAALKVPLMPIGKSLGVRRKDLKRVIVPVKEDTHEQEDA
jgi:hypothetical protein